MTATARGRTLFLDEARARLLARACARWADRTADAELRAELEEIALDLGYPIDPPDEGDDPETPAANMIRAVLGLVFRE